MCKACSSGCGLRVGVEECCGANLIWQLLGWSMCMAASMARKREGVGRSKSSLEIGTLAGLSAEERDRLLMPNSASVGHVVALLVKIVSGIENSRGHCRFD